LIPFFCAYSSHRVFFFAAGALDAIRRKVYIYKKLYGIEKQSYHTKVNDIICEINVLMIWVANSIPVQVQLISHFVMGRRMRIVNAHLLVPHLPRMGLKDTSWHVTSQVFRSIGRKTFYAYTIAIANYLSNKTYLFNIFITCPTI